MKHNLYKSPVVFIEDREAGIHEYVLGGAALKGVTGILSRQGISPSYSGVSQSVLSAAAAHGTMVHEDIQAHEEFGIPCVTPDGGKYCAVRPDGLEYVASEYLVSDERNYASKIDLVFWDPARRGYLLVDIKGTSELHSRSVQWQLSIYARFWEMFNRDLPIVGIAAAWVPNQDRYSDRDAEFRYLERIPSDEVDALLERDAAGGTFGTSMEEINAALPDDVRSVLALVRDVLEEEKAVAERKKDLTGRVKAFMEENRLTKWDNDFFSATIVAAGTSVTFDTTAFRKANPELYGQFTRTTAKKSSIRIQSK